MRISDWSSDVCSSDLLGDEPLRPWDAAARAVSTAAKAKVAIVFGCERTGLTNEELDLCHAVTMIPANPGYSSLNLSQAVQVLAYELRKASLPEENGRASCRERVCQYVSISVVAGEFKKKKT